MNGGWFMPLRYTNIILNIRIALYRVAFSSQLHAQSWKDVPLSVSMIFFGIFWILFLNHQAVLFVPVYRVLTTSPSRLSCHSEV